jgi:hypothetical protein
LPVLNPWIPLPVCREKINPIFLDMFLFLYGNCSLMFVHACFYTLGALMFILYCEAVLSKNVYSKSV